MHYTTAFFFTPYGDGEHCSKNIHESTFVCLRKSQRLALFEKLQLKNNSTSCLVDMQKKLRPLSTHTISISQLGFKAC